MDIFVVSVDTPLIFLVQEEQIECPEKQELKCLVRRVLL